MTKSAKDVKSGIIVEMSAGSGVVRTDDGLTMPLVGDSNESKRQGERVQFVVDKLSYDDTDPDAAFDMAKLWNPEPKGGF